MPKLHVTTDPRRPGMKTVTIEADTVDEVIALYERYEGVEYAATLRKEAALRPVGVADGWVDWKGGDLPPVSANVIVKCRLRDGYLMDGKAGECNWSHDEKECTRAAQIVAYRVVSS